MEKLEVEIKAYCDDVHEIRKGITSLGGEPLGSRIETDIYYNHPGRNFAETDEALRIRRMDQKKILTYKGPKIGTRSKTRIEKEVTVGDFDNMNEILVHLGFIEAGRVNKRREGYKLGEVHICIDSVDGLGDFVELEKISDERKETEDKLFALAAQLGLNRFERRSYLELVLGLH